MWPDVTFLGLSVYEWTLDIGVVLAFAVFRFCMDHYQTPRKFQLFCCCTGLGALVAGYLCAILFQAGYTAIQTGVFDFANAGTTFYGGVIGGAVFYLIVYFCLCKKVCGQSATVFLEPMLNSAVCGISIAHCLGRIGCLAEGCCHGIVSARGLYFPALGKTVLPTQLYESAFLLLLFAALLYLIRKGRGFPTAVYLIGYGSFRFVLEFLRGDERGAFVIPWLSPSQFWSVLLILLGAGLCMGRYAHKKTS